MHNPFKVRFGWSPLTRWPKWLVYQCLQGASHHANGQWSKAFRTRLVRVPYLSVLLMVPVFVCMVTIGRDSFMLPVWMLLWLEHGFLWFAARLWVRWILVETERWWTLITVDVERVWGFLRPCVFDFTHETNTAEASSVFDTKAVFTRNHKTVKSLSILAAKWYHDTVSMKKNSREKI